MSPIKAVMITLVLAGCLASCKASQTPGSSTWRSRGDVAGGNASPSQSLNKPAGVSQSTWVRTAIVPLGVVPYDNASLPLVSPDGRYIATQTGIAPSWSTVIAGADAEFPSLTKVEVYELDRREDVAPQSRRQPQWLFTLAEPALLGRSCDADGFLIESPRENGARWIGHVSWTGGDTVWLADDERVNAFASLGPDGRIAWSRRDLDAKHFDLVVRQGDREWQQAAADDDWLMPQWSGRGDGLFCLRLIGDELEIVFANASSEEAFRQSMRDYPLGPEANISTAYQTLSGQIALAAGPPPPRDQLLYFHPWLNRIALWRPLGGAGHTAMYLNPDSFAAVMEDSDVAIVATDKEVLRQRLSNARDVAGLTDGTYAIRPTPASVWQYLLLSPQEGEIGVTGLRLLPVDRASVVRP